MGFQFSKPEPFKLKLTDKVYELFDPFAPAIVSAQDKVLDFAAKIEAYEKDKTPESLERAFMVCRNFINELLGDETYDDIFQPEHKMLTFHVELMQYIMQEVNKFRLERLSHIYNIPAEAIEEVSE